MKKAIRIILIVIICIVLALVLIWAGLLLANNIASYTLKKYIDTFDTVSKPNVIEPTVDEDGHYVFTTDGDFKVMNLTDLHIGGGISSTKNDRKTIYEVCTMVLKEKPDLIILDGDNVFPVPGPIYNGGGTLNNRMVAKDVIHLFEHLGVYWTTVFGNHDTEAFDYFSREAIGELYSRDEYKYCLFKSEFSDTESKAPSVSNQAILVKNTSNEITKVLLMIDSNAYVDTSLASTINWLYDVVHEEQIDWARELITNLSNKEGRTVETLMFMHIPFGEYEEAYRELEQNNFNDTENTKYIEGVWDELVDEDMGGRIWFGGCSNKNIAPKDQDQLFETLGPDGLNTLKAVFCGHDHVNNAVVEYKGVMLSYGYSLDNLAYSDINKSGLQRGATVITISSNGEFTQEHRNAYTYYGCKTDLFENVYLDHYYYDNYVPTNR